MRISVVTERVSTAGSASHPRTSSAAVPCPTRLVRVDAGRQPVDLMPVLLASLRIGRSDAGKLSSGD
jgi:hypothetical protein